jgi:hypothetical protein
MARLNLKPKKIGCLTNQLLFQINKIKPVFHPTNNPKTTTLIAPIIKNNKETRQLLKMNLKIRGAVVICCSIKKVKGVIILLKIETSNRAKILNIIKVRNLISLNNIANKKISSKTPKIMLNNRNIHHLTKKPIKNQDKFSKLFKITLTKTTTPSNTVDHNK